MLSTKWDRVLRWLNRIRTILRRVTSRTAQPEPMPHSMRRGQVI